MPRITMKPSTKTRVVVRLIGCTALCAAPSTLAVGAPAQLEFDTELVSMTLTGGPFVMPLASDPGNALGDSIEGYGLVNASVAITLSSQRDPLPGPATLGKAFAFSEGLEVARTAGNLHLALANGTSLPPIDPSELHGQQFFVNSFFDVFFDITVTDVDPRPGHDFAGQLDGASLGLLDNGPAQMQSSYPAVFDKDAPNFGLLPPPEVSPYIGHFSIEIPLGGDINGNGEDDKIKFTLATHSVGDENRTFIILPDGTVLDTFDSAAFLDGAVVDESTDPPFTIGALDPTSGLPDPTSFGGPTTGSSRLVNPVVPEPEDWALITGAGLLGLAVWRRLARAGSTSASS